MKKAIPTLNVRLLNRVKRQILKEPKQFQMAKMFTSASFWNKDASEKIPNCGTAACIAGWTCSIMEKVTPKMADLKPRDPWIKAKRLLGLNQSQAERLFYAYNMYGTLEWPKKFARQYERATELKQWAKRAKVAAARIDHFIKTGQ